MKFSCLQENLKRGLTAVGQAVSRNVNLPILNNILIETNEKEIKLVATNLEIAITHKIRGQVEGNGVLTVQAKTINDYINLLPNQKINIKKEDDFLKIESGNYKTKIKTESADDFPLVPEIDRENFFSADTDDLRKALSQVVFAVSGSESRLELSGVFFQFSGEDLILASTDSYRLAEKKIKIKNESKLEEKIIVPAKTIQELLRVISSLKENSIKEEKEIKIYVSENQILFTVNSTELISKVIDGQYPDYKQIIPTQTKTKATLNRLEFLRAVKTSSIFSRSGVNDVNLDFPAGKNKTIVSSSSGSSGENTAELDAKNSGDDNGVRVNFSYLIDGLNNISSENIKIELVDNNTPCVIKPEVGEDYFYIIMPIKQ